MDKDPDFETMIQRHLTRAQKLRAIQQIIDEDPGIVPDLLEILTTSASPPAGPAPARRVAESPRRLDSKTQAEKVVAFFQSQENEPASVRDIAEGTGLTRNTVNALFYNSSEKRLFYRIRVGPKRVLWRLRREDDDDEEGVVDDPEIVAEHEEIMRRRGEPEE